jgi:antitoxin PrlF
MPVAKLSAVQEKGQVTIPAEIRSKLGLKKGDLVAFVETDQGVLISPQEVIATAALDGVSRILREKGISLEEMIESGRDIRGTLLEGRIRTERRSQSASAPGSGSRCDVDGLPLTDDVVVDKADVVAMFSQILRRSNQKVEGQPDAADGAVQHLSGVTAMGTFGNNDQQVNVTAGMRLPACRGPEQDDAQRVHRLDDLLRERSDGLLLSLLRDRAGLRHRATVSFHGARPV